MNLVFLWYHTIIHKYTVLLYYFSNTIRNYDKFNLIICIYVYICIYLCMYVWIDGGLPSTLRDTSAEHRPFFRKVPEFKFWYDSSKAVLYAFIFTFFEAFNLPVFWPILLMYFIILFVVRKISHLSQYHNLFYLYFIMRSIVIL